jgi:hypothetical protein
LEHPQRLPHWHHSALRPFEIGDPRRCPIARRALPASGCQMPFLSVSRNAILPGKARSLQKCPRGLGRCASLPSQRFSGQLSMTLTDTESAALARGTRSLRNSDWPTPESVTGCSHRLVFLQSVVILPNPCESFPHIVLRIGLRPGDLHSDFRLGGPFPDAVILPCLATFHSSPSQPFALVFAVGSPGWAEPTIHRASAPGA